ncbi:MAG: VOC family protein [Parcubacteria group bacterium]|nr:VOC family protein [Parcubacteria group bacterium]
MNNEEVLPFKILGLDHVAIAVKDITAWKKMYLFMGARIFYETNDASPNGKSSMKLCGVKLGEYSIALIEGIDREEISQVSAYVEAHGDHSFQHIAVAVDNIYAFVEWATVNNFHFLGPLKDRSDAFGDVKQVFARKFDKNLSPDEAPFYEFVERPNQEGRFISADSFSDDFAKEFFLQIEGAQKGFEDAIFYNIEQTLLSA